MTVRIAGNRRYPVRIGMFCDMYMPHVSGVTNHVMVYKRRFEELGHEVFVLTFGDRDYADAEMNVIRSPGIPWGKTGWRFALNHSPAARIVASALDVAHVHHPFQSGRIARRACNPRGIPVVYTNHTRYDLYSDVYSSFVPRSVRYAYLRSSLARAYADAALVVAPSNGIVEWLREFRVTDRATLIPNGIDTRPFAEPASRMSRAELDLTEDDIVVAHAGRIAHEKNIGVLLAAFGRALERVPRLALVVIGDGPALEAMRAQAEESGVAGRVRFLGMLPHSELPGALAVADIYASASVSETFGLTLLEASAAGLPVVGVRSPGVSDIVEEDRGGILTENDPREFAEAIQRIAHDPALRQRLAEGARESACRYDLEHTADVLLAHYERLAGA